MSDDNKPRRQKKGAPAPIGGRPDAAEAAPPCPGVAFKADFEGGRKGTLNLAGLGRETLATQTAELVWSEIQRRAPKGSRGIIEHPQNAIRLFCEHLEVADEERRVTSFANVVTSDVDAFEDYLRARFPETTYGEKVLRAFIALLKDAETAGLTRGDLSPRLAFVSMLPATKQTVVREPFPPIEMAALRKAATDGVKTAIRRRSAGERRLRLSKEIVDAYPDPPGAAAAASKITPMAAKFALDAAAAGPPMDMAKRERDLFLVENGVSVAAILGDLHANSVDAIAFVILIAEDTGIPIESVRDLSRNCLRNERGGHATLHYTKRRAGGDGSMTLDVSTRRRSSAGWLIKLFLAMSERTRRHATAEIAGWLFIGYSQRRIRRFDLAEAPVRAFLKVHQPLGQDGRPMEYAQLSRIRKNVKRDDYATIGGDLKRFASDHSRQVAATHYARLAANTEIHENAITQGLKAALGASTQTRTDVGAAGTKAMAEPTREDGDDVAVARCLDFDHSPYAAPGEPCGAPLLGCLDCPNAVVSEGNLPSLMQLLSDLVEKRQEMDLGGWVATCGTSYARILTILDLFPKAALARAAEEAASASGRSWPVAQLAYKI